VLALPNRDRRAERREETLGEILEEAWELARRDGLGGISLRELARRVGLRAPSLYTYFDSKHAIYDTMFAEGWRTYADRLAALEPSGDAEEDLRRASRVFIDFCVEDPVRYQLLKQRPIPGFEPSPQSYAVAVEVYDDLRSHMAALDITDQQDLDLWTALLSGLADQQIANDPGGDRWTRLLDTTVDMFLAHARARRRRARNR
jgi:AcrR family transcriptional regulator